MRALLLGLLFWQAAPEGDTAKPEPHRFLFKRALVAPVSTTQGSACLILDAGVYAHAAPALKDLRLFAGTHEVPYALTMSEPAEADRVEAEVSNRGVRGGRVVFDLNMPSRPYTDVTLDLSAHDFVAGAEVSGTNHPGDKPTRLGTFTLFDLGEQHLSRNTTLHLQESTFRTLHIEVSMGATPGMKPSAVTPDMIEGATVPPSREAQTVYTTVAASQTTTQRGRLTVAGFTVPARVPVERIAFSLPPGFKGNFSRSVEVHDKEAGSSAEAGERLAGTIERVRLADGEYQIQQEQLTVPATLGGNLQSESSVEVAVENGDDLPLPLSEIRLEMRERRLCFPSAGTNDLTLFYGDATLDAPVYDFGRLFVPGPNISKAELGPEEQNAAYVAEAPEVKPLNKRHPEVIWVGLLVVVCVLGVVAVHSARQVQG